MEKKVEITAVLDKSGSMQSIYAQTIDGFNSYLEKQKIELSGQAIFSLIQFNHNVETKFTNLDINEVPNLNNNNYQPSGTTALYDAIGQAINLQKERNKSVHPKNDVTTIILIITDGMENSSRKFDTKKILKKINKMRSKYSWKFIYIGANQDSIFEAGKIGISPKLAINYSTDDRGVKDIYSSVSYMLSSDSISSGKIMFSKEDRLKQKR